MLGKNLWPKYVFDLFEAFWEIISTYFCPHCFPVKFQLQSQTKYLEHWQSFMFSLPPPPRTMLCGLQTPGETLEQLENNNNIVLGRGCWVGLKENKEAEKYNFRSNSNYILSGIVYKFFTWIELFYCFY